MKFNKIMIISLLLLIVLTLGAVSATDNLTAGETSNLDELGVTYADILVDEDDGEEIDDEHVDDEYSEDDGYDEFKQDVYSYSTQYPTEYLIGDTTSIGVGIEEYVSGNVSIVIDEIEVYNQPVIIMSENDEGEFVGGNYIGLRDLDLDIGSHDYTVKYSGNDEYNPFTYTDSFECYYVKMNVPEEVVMGYYDEDAYSIVIFISPNATGNINVLIDNKEFFSKSVADIRSEDSDYVRIDLSSLEFSSHDYEIKYFGGNFDDVAQSGKFNVTYQFGVDCYDDEIYIGEDVNLRIFLPDDYTSLPIASVGDKTYTFIMDEGDNRYGSLTLSDFNIGENVIRVSYHDDKYPLKTAEFNVYVNYILDVPYYAAYNGDDAINIRLPVNATGNLVVNINGETKKVKLINGTATFLLKDYEVGDYPVVISYDGADYEVYAIENTLHILPNEKVPSKIWVNGNYNITIESPIDSTDNVVVSIAYADVPDELIYVLYNGSTAGLVNIPIPKLLSGEYYYVIIDYESGARNEYTVKVKSENPEWDFNVDIPKERMKYPVWDDWGNEIWIHGDEDLDGKLTLYFDGVEQNSVTADYGYMEIGYSYSKLSFGEHTWKVTYTGDTYYNDVVKEGTINLTWFEFPDYVAAGCDYEVPVGLGDVECVAALFIDGKEVDSKFLSWSAELALCNMSYGEHTYKLVVSGDVNLIQSGTFVSGTWISLRELDFPIADEIRLYVDLPEAATGKVTVTINGNDYKVDVIDTVARIIIPKLDKGEYAAVVAYSGDDKYQPVQKEVTIKVTGYGINYFYKNEQGLPELASIILPEDAAGDLVVVINEDEYKRVPLENGRAIVFFDDFAQEYYEITVSYDGDDYNVANRYLYYDNAPEIDVQSGIALGEDARIHIKLNATGSVKITVDGVEYGTVPFDDGEITTYVSGLNLGHHEITFDYIGDGDFNKYFYYEDELGEYVQSEFGCFVAPYNSYPFDQNKQIAYIGLPDDASGYFEVYIGSELYANVTVSGNYTEVSLKDHDTGWFRAGVKYFDKKYGNYTYNDYENYISITQDVNYEIEASNVDVPSVTIRLNEDATGMIALIIGDYLCAKKIDNGIVTFELPGLAEDKYDIKVKYSGEANYNAFDHEGTISFINSIDPKLNVSVKDIDVGGTAIVNIVINETIGGEVLVSVGNANYTVSVSDGKGSIQVPNLSVGTYEVTAKFNGNDLFTPSVTNALFKVNKVEKAADNKTLSLDNATESKTPTYSINLDEDATGVLTVTIGDKNYTAEVVNGKATVTVDDLPVGEYNVTVTYSGDAKYAPIVKTTTTKVVVDPKVVATQTTALYTAKYSVTVYGNDGKVANDANVVFKINDKTIKTVMTNMNGVASFNIPSKYLPNKKYTITATALSKTASKKVTIKQILSVKTVKVKKSAKKVVIKATLKKVNGNYLKSKKLTLKFNGKKYTAKTSKKGVAKFTIKKSALKKLKVGKKYTYKVTYLKTSVKKTVKVKK